jgi:hypothetical protein
MSAGPVRRLRRGLKASRPSEEGLREPGEPVAEPGELATRRRRANKKTDPPKDSRGQDSARSFDYSVASCAVARKGVYIAYLADNYVDYFKRRGVSNDRPGRWRRAREGGR